MRTYCFRLMIVLFVCICSCNKDKHQQTKFPSPAWQADTSALNAYSMTAVIELPGNLQKDINPQDKMAAFVNDDCRGVGVMVSRDTAPPVFYILIRGSGSEQSKIVIKYYSSKSSYLFATDGMLDFVIDDNYGTVDVPALPSFQAVN